MYMYNVLFVFAAFVFNSCFPFCLKVGERVVVKDNMGPGTVRFVGSVKFGPG